MMTSVPGYFHYTRWDKTHEQLYILWAHVSCWTELELQQVNISTDDYFIKGFVEYSPFES